MNPFEKINKIISLINDRIESGEEVNITKEDLNFPYRFSDVGGEIGNPQLPSELLNKLSPTTLNSIQLLLKED